MANSDEGTKAGNQDEVPHTVDAGVYESQVEMLGHKSLETVQEEEQKQRQRLADSVMQGIKNPLSKFGKGLKGTATKSSTEVTSALGRNNSFAGTNPTDEKQTSGTPKPLSFSKAQGAGEQETLLALHSLGSSGAQRTHSRTVSCLSEISTAGTAQTSSRPAVAGNRVRRRAEDEDMYLHGKTRFWQFWKPPSGAYVSPAEEPTASWPEGKMSIWQKIKRSLPFVGGDEDEDVHEYPLAYDPEYAEDEDGEAEWGKYLKKKDRPTHRLPPFGITWLPGLPLFNKKTDTIYWCRRELARLNLEIEEDQKHPERFPLMTSAFVQFNHQVAAHMACQSVVHHLPRQMSPRINEISPATSSGTTCPSPGGRSGCGPPSSPPSSRP